MAAVKPAAGNPGIAPLSIIAMLWKQKIPILLIWVIVTIAGGAIVHELPAIYTSEALILVDSQKIPEKFVSSTVSTDLQDRIATISQQILSSTRLKKIIADFDLYHQERKSHFEEEILEMMRKDISIKLQGGWTGNRPGAFRIGFQGKNPTVVAGVANRLANLYIDENLKTREVQAEGTSEFIDSQLQEAQKRLDELEAAVSTYKVKHNGELPQQEGALSGALSRLQLELETNREAINRAQDAKVVLESTLKTVESAAAILTRRSEEDAPDRGAAPTGGRPQPLKGSEVLQNQLAILRIRYGDDHPDVKRLRSEIARLKALEEAGAKTASISAETKGKSETSQSAAAGPAAPARSEARAPQFSAADAADQAKTRERIANLTSQIMLSDKELEFRKAEQRRILRDISDYQSRLNRLPIREQEMAQVTRDYEISKANYKSLLDKKLAAEMASDMEHRQKSERFTILDAASVPEKPSKPNRPVLAGAASLIGLLVSLVLGLGREFHKGKLLGDWELPAGTPILARLPEISIPGAAPAPPRANGTRTRRVVLVSSALLSLLGMIVAGVYLVSHRF